MKFDQNMYIFKGNVSTSSANFDLPEMMRSFSFANLCSNPNLDTDTEGAIVILENK